MKLDTLLGRRGRLLGTHRKSNLQSPASRISLWTPNSSRHSQNKWSQRRSESRVMARDEGWRLQLTETSSSMTNLEKQESSVPRVSPGNEILILSKNKRRVRQDSWPKRKSRSFSRRRLINLSSNSIWSKMRIGTWKPRSIDSEIDRKVNRRLLGLSQSSESQAQL